MGRNFLRLLAVWVLAWVAVIYVNRPAISVVVGPAGMGLIAVGCVAAVGCSLIVLFKPRLWR